MPSYTPPVADFEFLMFDVLEVEKHTDLRGYADLDRATVRDVLEGAGKFMSQVLQPLNQSGDEEGCHFENGVVRCGSFRIAAYARLPAELHISCRSWRNQAC